MFIYIYIYSINIYIYIYIYIYYKYIYIYIYVYIYTVYIDIYIYIAIHTLLLCAAFGDSARLLCGAVRHDCVCSTSEACAQPTVALSDTQRGWLARSLEAP